jgi:uncharacterized delta-60 repeat protein
MSDKTQLEKGNTGRSKRAGVWRHARQALALAVVMLMVAGGWPVKVGAVPGNLDLTFSTDGKLTTSFAVDDYAEAVAIQSNGRIVVAGYSGPSGNRDFAVARYNGNGTLDASFSTDGKQTTDFFGENDFVLAVAIQDDGKIIAAGQVSSENAGTDFGLARYNTNGTLDATFSGDGLVTTDFSGGNDSAADILIQPNGKIVVGGLAQSNGTGNDFALARYNTNGTLDATFSGDGKTITDFGDNSEANGIALQSTGRIVAAGWVYAGGVNAKFALARYNGNGSLDNGSLSDSTPNDEFGTDGLAMTDFFNHFDIAHDVAIQSDDKIVAVGYATHPGYDFAVARYEADGALDNSFSGDGKLTTGFFNNRYDEAKAVAIQPDGKIVVAGTARVLTPRYNFAVARYYGN